MAESTLCSSCLEIFKGSYITVGEYLKHHSDQIPHSQLLFPTQRHHWRLKLDVPLASQQRPSLHLHHSIQKLAEARHECSLCAMIYDQPRDLSDDYEDHNWAIPLIVSQEHLFPWGAFKLCFLYVQSVKDGSYTHRGIRELNNFEVVGK